jgi:HYR domain
MCRNQVKEHQAGKKCRAPRTLEVPRQTVCKAAQLRRRKKETLLMNQPHTLRLASWARLVGLALLLGVGMLASLGLASRTAHAQPAATIIVSTCDESHLDSAISGAASGDTITFACSGTITLSQTLVISKNLILDGSGQAVTLDGQNQVKVLTVNSGVSFTLNALAIAHGSALGSNGGGLDNKGGTVSITNSTFANNSDPTGGGGGLFNDIGGTVSITNSTFANNSVEGHEGGGLENSRGTVSITNSTFSGNSAGGGGGINNTLGTVKIGGSIVANNTGGNCSGGVSDQGYNLSSDSSCGFTGTGSLQNTDPKLNPGGLQNNGGPTQTIALQSGSPASDTIPSASCPSTDQRGVSRLDNGESTCDMGAYEFVDPPDHDLALTNVPANITVNATSSQGATVTYTPPTATDESGDNPGPSVNCNPASGSIFPIGTTKVTCTASDSDDLNSPVSQSFTVTVNGAATQVNNTITLVNSFHLSPGGIQTSFDSQLQSVQTDLSNNNTAQACSDLTSFINHAQAQSGKHLTVSQANQLIAAAEQIQAVLGC